jgi:MFS family permease
MISDKYGRKPAILIGTFGAAIGMLVLGLAKTYTQAIMGRVIAGFLSGNLGCVKAYLTEITDDTNRGDGFSYMSVAWNIGCMVAPLIGISTILLLKLSLLIIFIIIFMQTINRRYVMQTI